MHSVYCPLSWNGIRLAIPPTWHPALIGRESLLFEEDDRPVLALKWKRGGRTVPSGHFLHSIHRSLDGKDVRISHPSPPLLPAAFESWERKTLAWEGEESGFALFLRNEKDSLYLQLFSYDALNQDIFQNVVRELSWHKHGVPWQWRVFDISFSLPSDARLTQHEFLPGSFRITFRLRHQRITYYRFRPAAALLRQASLKEFSRRLVRPGMEVADWSCSERIRWHSPTPGPIQAFLIRLLRRPALWCTELWYCASENVILGINLQAPDIDKRYLASLCRKYRPC